MCGIFGIAYGPLGPEGEEWTPTEMLEMMFPAIQHRGPHSWGYMYCGADGDGIDYFKQVGKVDSPTALREIDVPGDVKWVVGHVRFATNGKPEHLANNHPIPHGDIVGVHNGKLRDWKKILDVTGREDESSEVDSEAIFAAVNKWGMRAGLSRIEGDMVAVFAHRNNATVLRIARTYNRPLVYTFTPNGSMVFASEELVIEATGIAHSRINDWKGRYKLLTVREGRITERVQFRDPRDFTPSHGPVAPRLPGKVFDGVRGITDYFDRRPGTSPVRESTAMGAHPTPNALAGIVHPGRPDTKSITKRDMMIRKPDRFGGMYLGANTYRTPEGEMMNAEEYVEWAVTQRLTEVSTAITAQSVSDQVEVNLENLRTTDDH